MAPRQPRHLFGAAHPDAPREFAARTEAHRTTHRAARLLRRRFFDTFDWRLHARGWVLTQNVNDLVLRDQADGARVARIKGLTTLPSRFVRDWPDGPLKDLVAPVVGVRAVLHLVTLEGPAHTDRWVDPKTGRAWLIDHRDLHQVRRAATRPFLQVVAAAPADDRTTGGHRLARLLRSCGYRTIDPTLFVPAMARAGLEPGGYAKGFRLDLDPRRSAGAAGAAIAMALVGRMRANRRGLEQDIDPEFLHDFRVATRRLRTWVAEARGLLPARLRDEATDLLRALGGATNRLRDLDVFLQQRDDLVALLPADRHDEAELVFARAADARTLCRRELDARLADPHFLAVLDWAAAHLGVEGAKPPKRARRRVGPEADRLLLRSYERLRARGDTLGPRPAAADLHRVRIAAKRHRYVVEFFASLYRADAVGAHLDRLRTLQDVLGAHNDAAMQRRELARLAPDLAAADALTTALAARQEAECDRFAAAWDAVAGRGCRRKLRRLVRGRRKNAR
ncbi:CHAD domain-containing protein [bacterium]|nr:CHAD domain-containing protein [bacterium]